MSATEKSNTLQAVETILNYHFSNPALLWEALQAAGAIFPNERPLPNGSKRLALVGDGVLGLALRENWYLSGALLLRGDQITQQVATNDNLARVGRSLGLDQYVNRRGTGAFGPVAPRTVSDSVEAVLGAVYFDGGMRHVRQVMVTMGLVPT